MTSVAVEAPTAPTVRARHFVLAVLALAMGGFAIGTTEFVTMGLLPEIAQGVGVSIPRAGRVISAYALGVVVGAPVLAYFGARFPRRGLLLVLVAWLGIGNAMSAVAGSFGLLTAARFFAGLPHGAFFGVASLVAASMATPARRGRAVSMVMIGLAVANIVGVPAATYLGQHVGWRSAYWSVTGIVAVTMLLILFFVPACPGDPAATGRRELSAFLRPQVWLTLLVGAVGFGGMFAVYSYIAPTITEVGGLASSAVPWFLLAFGLGMTAGTFLGGHLADWSVFRSLLISSVATGLLLLLFFFTAPLGWPSILNLFAISVASSVLVVNLQLRLMEVAGDAQTVGAAMNHASLNIANAFGAWLGGLVIAAGFGYTAPALVGAGLSALGVGILLVSARMHVRTTAAERAG